MWGCRKGPGESPPPLACFSGQGTARQGLVAGVSLPPTPFPPPRGCLHLEIAFNVGTAQSVQGAGQRVSAWDPVSPSPSLGDDTPSQDLISPLCFLSCHSLPWIPCRYSLPVSHLPGPLSCISSLRPKWSQLSCPTEQRVTGADLSICRWAEVPTGHVGHLLVPDLLLHLADLGPSLL